MSAALLPLVKAQGTRLWPGRHLSQPFIVTVGQALIILQKAFFLSVLPPAALAAGMAEGSPAMPALRAGCFQTRWKQPQLWSTSEKGNPQTFPRSQFSSMQFTFSRHLCWKRNFMWQRARDLIVHSSNFLLYLRDGISGSLYTRESPRLITEILRWHNTHSNKKHIWI